MGVAKQELAAAVALAEAARGTVEAERAELERTNAAVVELERKLEVQGREASLAL